MVLVLQPPPLWNLLVGEKVRTEELVEIQIEMAPQTSLEEVQTPLSVGPLAQCHPASLPQAVVENRHPCLHLHDLLGDEVRAFRTL